MFQTKVVEKIKTHVLCSPKNPAVYEVIWKKKYFRAGQATNDNTAHAHCMLDT